MRQIKTYYSVTVDGIRDRELISRNPCTMMTRETLTEAIADGMAQAAYYLGLGIDAEVTIVEECDRCNGDGKLPKGRQSKLVTHNHIFKPCPTCKGKGKLQTIGPIDCRYMANMFTQAQACVE